MIKIFTGKAVNNQAMKHVGKFNKKFLDNNLNNKLQWKV